MGEAQLDAVLVAVVGDQGWGGVQPAGQCNERGRWQGGIGHCRKVHGAVERDDEGEVTGRQTAMHPGFGALDPVAGVARDQWTEPRPWPTHNHLHQRLAHGSNRTVWV